MKKYLILGVPISYSDYGYFVERIITAAKRNRLFKVAPVASHPVKKSFFGKKLKKALTGFDLVLPDGQSLVWAARTLYNADIKERIYGPELFNRITQRCEKEKIKILLYGNHTDRLVKNLKSRYKRLSVTNVLNLEGKPVTKEDLTSLVKKLRKYDKSVLFIGIGSPAQHFLMADLKGIGMPVVAVGAAFDFLAGVKKQAPNWVQSIGLEWLFRFLSEPWRLWRRYLIDAPTFVLLVFLQKVRLIR
jgi:exopolysaccharide biosynthesis WecB/TagA/CpsF family protein